MVEVVVVYHVLRDRVVRVAVAARRSVARFRSIVSVAVVGSHLDERVFYAAPACFVHRVILGKSFLLQRFMSITPSSDKQHVPLHDDRDE